MILRKGIVFSNVENLYGNTEILNYINYILNFVV